MTKAIAQVGTGKYQSSTSATLALDAFASSNTAGNSIYVFVYGYKDGNTGWAVSSIADTKGNTYTAQAIGGTDTVGTGRSQPEIWAAHNIGSQASNVVTITFNNSNAKFSHAQAIEVSAGGIQSLDQSGYGNPAYSVSPATATAGGANTDASAIALFVGGEFIAGGTDATLGLPTNYTSTYLYTTTSNYKPAARFGYRILTASETTSINVSTDNTSGSVVALVATFKEASGGTNVTPNTAGLSV